MLETDHVEIQKNRLHPYVPSMNQPVNPGTQSTHWTFLGSRENIRLNNPNPNAVPDSIRSSTGPSGAVSNGRSIVDAEIPTQRERKLLPINVVGEAGANGFRAVIEFAADEKKNDEGD